MIDCIKTVGKIFRTDNTLIIEIDTEIINIKESFPIFNDKCNKIFKSLKIFQIYNPELKLDSIILENIYNNLDKMPILRIFEIKCDSNYINKELYIKFIIKLLKMKLKRIKINLNLNKFEIDREDYSIDELKEIYPDIKYNLNNIIIEKYNNFIF